MLFSKFPEIYLLVETTQVLFSKGQLKTHYKVLIIFADILSQPWALAGPKFFIISDINMFSSIISNDVILALVLYENNGNTLEIFVGVHIDAKNY